MSWWTQQRLAYAVNYLVANGLSPWGAAALVARWAYVEASGGPASVNPSSGAFGIAQWLGSRKPAIYGNTNFDDQLAYAVSELNGPESRAANVLRGAGDAYTGAVGASMFERAEGYNASTGVDNFTSRTASRAPSVLQAWQSTAAVSVPNVPTTGDDVGYYTSDFFEDTDTWLPTPDTSSAIGIGSAVAIGAAALLLILFLDPFGE